MRPSALAAGLVGVAALVAAGCGDEERPTITGTGYSFQAPPGWDAVSPDAFKELAAGDGGLTPTQQQTQIDGAAANVDDGANISVALQPGRPFPKRVGQAAVADLEKIYSTPAIMDQFLPEGVRLAGDPVVGQTELAGTPMLEATLETTGAREAGLVQLIGPHESQGYTITFTAPDTDSAADDLDEVVATWQWQ